MRNQQKQKEKESILLDWLQDKFGTLMTRSTKEQDIKEGWDFTLYGRKYDLKASTSMKLTVHKVIWTGEEAVSYNPMLRHPYISYVLPFQGKLVILDRQRLYRSLRSFPHEKGVYTGDGNVNMWYKLTSMDIQEAFEGYITIHGHSDILTPYIHNLLG